MISYFASIRTLFLVCYYFETIKAQNYGDLRVVQRNVTDPSFSAGRLEVYINSTWGSICADNFDMVDARVACRQLGYSGAISTDSSLHTPYGRGTEGPIWLDEVSCEDRDLIHLLSCPNSGIGEHDCNHFSDVAVVCTDMSLLAPPQDMDVRLVGQEYKSEGAIELYCNGQWNTLCAMDTFEKDEADLICRQLGFTEARIFETVDIFSPDYDSDIVEELILYEQLDCPSGASHIASCGSMCGQTNSSITNRTQCYMSIECVHTLPYGAIRLAQGEDSITSKYSAAGRVEVFRNGKWGTVCMEGFDQLAANISCQQLGFMRAVKYQSSVDAGFGEGDGPITLSGLHCSPQDKVLALCSRSPVNCSHSDDVAVFCNNLMPATPTDEIPKTTGLSTATFIGIIVGSCFALLLFCICLGVCSMHLFLMPYDVKKEQAQHGLYFIEHEGSPIDGENETNLDQKLSDLEITIEEDPIREDLTAELAAPSVEKLTSDKMEGSSINASRVSLNTIPVCSPISGPKEPLKHAIYFNEDSNSLHSLDSLSLGPFNSSSLENLRPLPFPTKVPISPVLRRQLNKCGNSVPTPGQFSGFTETGAAVSESDPPTKSSQDCEDHISASPPARRGSDLPLQSSGEDSPLLVSQTASTPLTSSPARSIMKSAKSLEAQNIPHDLECNEECSQVYTCQEEEEEEDQALDSESTQSKHAHVSFRFD